MINYSHYCHTNVYMVLYNFQVEVIIHVQCTLYDNINHVPVTSKLWSGMTTHFVIIVLCCYTCMYNCPDIIIIMIEKEF